MSEIEEPTFHICKHGRAIWSDEDENDDREGCVDCVLDHYRKQIKSQEATIDALLAQNKTQMLELEKLEAWQKEAVEHLKKLQRKCDFLKEEIDVIGLIKQAEEK